MNCGSNGWYGPVVDGVELKESPYDAVLAGSNAIDYSVPIVIGNALEDKLLDIGRHATEAKLRKVVEHELETDYGKDVVDKALQLYPLSIFSDYATRLFPQDWTPAYWAARVMFADRDFTCAMRRAVRQWRKHGGTAFWFSWTQPQVFHEATLEQLRNSSDEKDAMPFGGSCYPCPGAGHGADLDFLFDNPSKIDVRGKLVQGDRLTDRLQAFYVNFVWAEGDVDIDAQQRDEFLGDLGVALPEWHRYRESTDNCMRFEAGVSQEVKNYRAQECDFWDAHPKKSR